MSEKMQWLFGILSGFSANLCGFSCFMALMSSMMGHSTSLGWIGLIIFTGIAGIIFGLYKDD